ncbi:Ribosomal protein-like protein [Fragilaria crotonensis]|nr:Ribosomal protein-like protein [Fragilaria crotonensis]
MSGASEKATTMMVLLMTAALLPILVEFILNYERQRKEEEVKRRALLAAEVALGVRRQLDGRDHPRGGEETAPKRRRRSQFRHQRAQLAVQEDYFSPTPVFDDKQYERIFRVTKQMTQNMLNICAITDPFFTSQQDVSGRYNIDPLVKVLMALKLVAYGCSPSAFQDYFQMSEATARICLLKFCQIVSRDESLRSVFARKMTRADAKRISAMHEAQHGMAGMIGSLDCTHVCWKNCPVAWQGSQTGKEGKPTIVLEAFADFNLWFWHHSFGWPGSLNDINIWDRSSLLKSFLDGSFAADVDFEFEVGGRVFNRLWLMVDGIYPELSRFVKTVEEPSDRKASAYAKWQEAARKDIERAFGVLQRKFHVLVRKIEMWYVGDIACVVNTCIMLHNMMVSHRIDTDEVESEVLYVYDGRLETDEQDIAPGAGLEPEQQHVNRRAAEMELHQQLFEINRQDCHLSYQQKAIIDSLRFQYVQQRWECLYNLEEHHRLKNACMDQLLLMMMNSRTITDV